MKKVTIADLKSNRHEVLMVLGYTIVLIMVYVSLIYVFTKMFWLSFFIAILILMGGMAFLYIWIAVKKKKCK